MRQSSQMLLRQAVILASMFLVMAVSPSMGEVTDDKCKCLACVCDVDPHPLPPAVPSRHPPPAEPEPEPEPEPIPTPKCYPPPSEPEPKPVYYPPPSEPEPTPGYYYTPPSEPEPTPGYYYTPPAGSYGYPWGDTYGSPAQMYPREYYPSSAHRRMCRGISSQLLAYFMLAAGVLSLLTCLV